MNHSHVYDCILTSHFINDLFIAKFFDPGRLFRLMINIHTPAVYRHLY